MNVVLHLELSQIIRKAVEKELDIKIDALSFMYGNIKPDIRPTSVSHYKHTAMEFVQDEIEKLASLRFNKSKRWKKQFSERMGIITHYLSDFFCYAHSQFFQNEIKSHFLYELRQLYYFKKNQKVVTDLYNHLISSLSANSINSCIEAAHERYTNIINDNRFPYEWDTVNAVGICVLICIHITSICLENQLKIAV
ncbi:MAG TPA: zinc dependent phospholipase C family protein [Desulfitobacteriaceae bacterium]|jgi:hypothetical protein|nr:zinc dependent phospholipase C family protein [Desulfitobacteriaceae bacterium]